MSEEPSTYIIDEKDAKYYRNRFLNNVATRIRYATKLSNQLTSIKNILDLYESLQEKSYGSDNQIYSNFVNSFNNFVECREKLLEQLSVEKNNLLETDFEAILKETTEKIKATENEKNNTEVK